MKNGSEKTPKTKRVRPAIKWIVISLFLILSIALISICLLSHNIKEAADHYSAMYLILLAIFLCLLAIFTSLLKVWYSYVIASKTARSESAKRYYDIHFNTDDHTFFLENNTRKDTTYMDDHMENISRQHRRWGLWIILAVALAASLLISIACHSFPLFLGTGLIEIIVFMYADYFPANRQFYEDYGKIQNYIIDRDISPDEAKAIFYMDEYESTKFDIKNPEYHIRFRNLFTIKKDILSARNRSMQVPLRHLPRREEFFSFPDDNQDQSKNEKNLPSWPDLKLDAFEIRHIYKMCFDRIRNRQLVINIVLTLILLFVIGLDFSAYSRYLASYFMIPDTMRIPITIISITGIMIASLIQIFLMPMTERIVAEVSYKSRYVVDERLNDLLGEDIVGFTKLIKPIDIARGIYQAQGYVMTTDKNGNTQIRAKELEWYDRPLFHYQEFSNRRRLVITVYLLMGSLIALIWQFGLWWLLPLIILLAIITHLLLQKYLLPNLGKEKLKKDIEKLMQL